MSFKHFAFYAGCIFAWFIVLPICAVCGGIAILGYAICTEVGEMFSGHGGPAVDDSTAREIAHRMFIGR